MNRWRDTDLVPALVASAVLLIWYQGLGLNLPAGIAVCLVLYGGGRWAVLGRPRARIRHSFADAEEQLRRLRQISHGIRDADILAMVKAIDADADRIIGLAFRRRQHLATSQNVVDLYLRSTIDLLQRYQELQVHDIRSADAALVEARQVLPGIHELLVNTWEEMHRDDVLELKTQTDRLRALLSAGRSGSRSGEAESA